MPVSECIEVRMEIVNDGTEVADVRCEIRESALQPGVRPLARPVVAIHTLAESDCNTLTPFTQLTEAVTEVLSGPGRMVWEARVVNRVVCLGRL